MMQQQTGVVQFCRWIIRHTDSFEASNDLRKEGVLFPPFWRPDLYLAKAWA